MSMRLEPAELVLMERDHFSVEPALVFHPPIEFGRGVTLGVHLRPEIQQ